MSPPCRRVAAGALLLGRFLRSRAPARPVAADALLPATALGAIPGCHLPGTLSIELYVALLAVSSVLHAWGRTGVHSLLTGTLAASSAVRVLAVPLGTALGGPLVAGLGAREPLLVSAAGVAVLGPAAAGVARAGRKRRR
ncbi:hypothetical protein ACIQZO_25455 [Streptomyces sp. NPDC097617]|uniref:hypothetical protein n=1 Tax=Streptomyces sp. NPDC097617 TaxID=3366091 RepID=UPI003817006F